MMRKNGLKKHINKQLYFIFRRAGFCFFILPVLLLSQVHVSEGTTFSIQENAVVYIDTAASKKILTEETNIYITKGVTVYNLDKYSQVRLLYPHSDKNIASKTQKVKQFSSSKRTKNRLPKKEQTYYQLTNNSNIFHLNFGSEQSAIVTNTFPTTKNEGILSEPENLIIFQCPLILSEKIFSRNEQSLLLYITVQTVRPPPLS